jgi:hypothetical protein
MVEGCNRNKNYRGNKRGFPNRNDLERHQKSVHKLKPLHGSNKNFICAGRSCAGKEEKTWDRQDNFKAHCNRVHKDEDLAKLLERSALLYASIAKC